MGLAEDIEILCTNLPDKSLLLRASTPDLKIQFFKEKEKTSLLGQLLKARFGGGGGNLAKQFLNAGKINHETYHMQMSILNKYSSLFTLYQTAWVEIEMVFINLENSPKSENELFLKTLEEFTNNNFLRAVNGYRFSIKEGMKIGKLISDINKRGQKDPDWNFLLTDDEQIKVNELKPGKPDDTWKNIALSVCEHAAKKDSSIKRALRRYINDDVYLFTLLERACYAETRKNPPGLLHSKKWDDGIQKIRTAKGFKPVTEVNIKRP